jgi:transcriptional regulator GlxA family with amidase domain
MKTAILLYDQMTCLDAMGPYEVLGALPGNEVWFVAERRGEIRPDTRALGLVADRSIADVDSVDILVVPGGNDEPTRNNPKILDWIRRIDQTTQWTTSVCTGSLILGAAGLLRGKRATTHWFVHDELAKYGATPTVERVVEDGKIITAAGVSAGIDMALRLVQKLAGDEVSQGIQLALEYDPQPPFDSGSPAKAPAPIAQLVRSIFEQRFAERAASMAAEAATA